MRYDLVVIGNTVAGRSAALTAAHLGRCVALVDRAMDEAVSTAQLEWAGVRIFRGQPRFIGSNAIEVEGVVGLEQLVAERIVIACGTRAIRPERVPFDGRRVVDVDEAQQWETVPSSVIVVGGGTAGLRTAIRMAAAGARVTVIDGKQTLGEDRQSQSLLNRATNVGVTVQLGEDVIGIEGIDPQGATAILCGGARIRAELVIYCVGREGDVRELNLAVAGIDADDRGRLWCNADHQTWEPHIYAIGEIVGFPQDNESAVAQGRRVAVNALGGTVQLESQSTLLATAC